MKNTKYIFITLIILFVIFIVYVFLSSLLQSDPSVIVGVLGLLGSVFAVLLAHDRTNKREVNSRVFQYKKESYEQMINLLFIFLEKTKKGENISENEMAESMISFKKSLTLWGSSETIMCLNKYEKLSQTNPSPGEILFAMDDLLRSFRKDLGHDDRRFQKGELIGIVLTAKARTELGLADH